MIAGLIPYSSIREGQQVLRAVMHDIEHRFHITHTTVQIEVEGCDANDMYCICPSAENALSRTLTTDHHRHEIGPDY